MKSTGKISIDRLIFIVVILLVLVMAARTPVDSDLWWHLRAGEWTIQQATPIVKDYFSNSAAGSQWINHSWLGEVFFYLFYQGAGFLGIGLLTTLLAGGSMVLVYLTMQGQAIIKAFLLILASVIVSFVWSPRPQLFSMLLLAWLAFILYDYKWNRKKRLWQMPLIFLLWANLHGGYPLGLALIMANVGGETLNRLLGFEGTEILSWREILELGGWGLASILVLCINPNGLLIYVVPFQTVGVQVLQKSIQEWASPDFHDLAEQVLLIALFSGIFFIGISGRRLDGTDALIFIGFAYLAFVARRNFGPFGIAAVPVISRYLEPALNQWLERLRLKDNLAGLLGPGIKNDFDLVKAPFAPKLKIIINSLLVGLLVLIFLGKLWWVTSPNMINQSISDAYPVEAIHWLETNHPPGILLNEYNAGGYLIWALRSYPVFVDGRTDMYGDQLLQDWLTMVNAQNDWANLMAKYHIGIVMVEPNRPIVQQLLQMGWNKPYEDDKAVILVSGD